MNEGLRDANTAASKPTRTNLKLGAMCACVYI